jgi:DNA-binding beta-propeller fold protein YncE
MVVTNPDTRVCGPGERTSQGIAPAAVAFDGGSIWVANEGSGTVCKLTG